MINSFRFLTIFLTALFVSGCQTASPVHSSTEAREDATGALSAVAGAISGKPLSQEDLRHLEKQIQTDEEAQTAVRAITESVGGKAAAVKYCPVNGERYAPQFEVCPVHHVPLKIVDQ